MRKENSIKYTVGIVSALDSESRLLTTSDITDPAWFDEFVYKLFQE
jgi:hypothetical protein